jgi:hypothetical protein
MLCDFKALLSSSLKICFQLRFFSGFLSKISKPSTDKGFVNLGKPIKKQSWKFLSRFQLRFGGCYDKKITRQGGLRTHDLPGSFFHLPDPAATCDHHAGLPFKFNSGRVKSQHSGSIRPGGLKLFRENPVIESKLLPLFKRENPPL